MKSFVEPHMRDSLKDHVLEKVLDTDRFVGFYLRRPSGGRMMSSLLLFTPEGIILTGDLSTGRRGSISAFGYNLDWFASDLGEDYLCGKFLDKSWHADLAERELREEAAQVRAGLNDEEYDNHQLTLAANDRTLMAEELRGLRADLRGADDAELAADIKGQIADLRKDALDGKKALLDARKELADDLERLADDCNNMTPSEFEEEYIAIIRHDDLDFSFPGYGYPPADAGWLCAIQQKFRELHRETVTA